MAAKLLPRLRKVKSNSHGQSLRDRRAPKPYQTLDPPRVEAPKPTALVTYLIEAASTFEDT